MNQESGIDNPKRSKALVWVLGLFLVVALGSIIFFVTKVNQAGSSESMPVNFHVVKGTRSRLIAQQLDERGIINNPTVFLIYVFFHNASGKIQAGDYVLDPHMNIVEIVDVLTRGKVVPTDRRVTVIEGWTNKQLASFLKDRGITTAVEFNRVLGQKFDFKFASVAQPYAYQGFLFPDTYLLAKDAGVDVLINKMLKNFEGEISERVLADLSAKKVKLSDAIILASIIEKEVGRNRQTLSADDKGAMQKERELVASVFYNRLAAGMPLESDATINYITGKSDRQVSLLDAKIKSPYNTYMYKGLPPMPISNPGLGSIMAAIYPAQSDYFYFLNKPDGEAVFAKTLAEHNASKAKYLK